MNATVKTVLLTVLTLSVFAIALVELSGISRNSLFNKLNIKDETGIVPKVSDERHEMEEQAKLDEQVKNMPKTTLLVEEPKFDFGRIKEGDTVRHTFMVKNIGSNPLLISNVQVSCGCTAPFFPKKPIAPGATGEVTLQFNSAGKHDTVAKNALIVANADNAPFSIGFQAIVEKK